MDRQHDDVVVQYPEVDCVRKALKCCPSCFAARTRKRPWISRDTGDDAVHRLPKLCTKPLPPPFVPTAYFQGRRPRPAVES